MTASCFYANGLSQCATAPETTRTKSALGAGSCIEASRTGRICYYNPVTSIPTHWTSLPTYAVGDNCCVPTLKGKDCPGGNVASWRLSLCSCKSWTLHWDASYKRSIARSLQSRVYFSAGTRARKWLYVRRTYAYHGLKIIFYQVKVDSSSNQFPTFYF